MSAAFDNTEAKRETAPDRQLAEVSLQAEGVAAMCKAMEDMRNEAVMDERKDVACRLLKMGGMTLDKIAEISKLSIEEVRMLASQKNA